MKVWAKDYCRLTSCDLYVSCSIASAEVTDALVAVDLNKAPVLKQGEQCTEALVNSAMPIWPKDAPPFQHVLSSVPRICDAKRVHRRRCLLVMLKEGKMEIAFGDF
jgi:hypothetical protein